MPAEGSRLWGQKSPLVGGGAGWKYAVTHNPPRASRGDLSWGHSQTQPHKVIPVRGEGQQEPGAEEAPKEASFPRKPDGAPAHQDHRVLAGGVGRPLREAAQGQ